MTFEHWITEIAHPGNNPRGDFIRDTRDEIEAGNIRDGEIDSLSSLHGVMFRVSRGVPHYGASEEAEHCWQEYRQAAQAAA